MAFHCRLVALLSLVLACSCRNEWPDDQLVIAVPTAARTLDPRVAVDAASTRLWRLVFAGLTRVESDGGVALDLAESMTPVLRDAEGEPLAWQIRLRSDLRFHDGSPLEAADVVCTWRSVADPRLGSPVAGEFARRVASVRALDARTVRFDLVAPLATFASDLILGIVPRSACSRPDLRMGALVGAGPFAVVDATRLDAVMLRRMPPGGTTTTRAQTLLVRAIPDESGRALAVLGGGADVALGLSPLVLEAVADHDEARVVAAPGIAFSYLALNTRAAALADARVRHAVQAGLDRAGLVRTLLGGRGRAAAGMFAADHWAAPPELQAAAFDPTAARALFDAAGLGVAADGVRLRLRLLVPASRQRRREAEAIARALREVEVEVDVRSLEIGAMLAELRAGRFDAFLLGLPEPLEPDYLGWMFHGRNRPELRAPPWPGAPAAGAVADAFACQLVTARAQAQTLVEIGGAALGLVSARGAGNRSGIDDPLLNCLLDVGRRSGDRARRAAAYQAAASVLAAELPIVPLWHEDQVALVHRRVGAVSPAADGRLAPWADAPLQPR